MTTRDKVEEWLNNKPEELILCSGIDVEEITTSESVMGKLTPIIIKGGFRINMEFKSATWDEED